LGSIGGITTADELEAFRLGAISILLADGARAELQKGLGGRKARTRARKAETAKSAVLMGYSRARYRFKKRPVSTRQLLPKHQRATLSPDGYSHIITRLLPSAWPVQPILIRSLSLNADVTFSRSAVTSNTLTSSSVARQLSLKLRRHLQVTRRYL
jgi:hypothetical protein